MRRGILAIAFALGACQSAPLPRGPAVPEPGAPLSPGKFSASWAMLLGSKAIKLHRPARALPYLAACLAWDPERIACRWEKGWAHSALFQWENAVREWEKVKVKEPKRPKLAKSLSEARIMVATERRIRAEPSPLPGPAHAPAALTIRAVGDVNMGTPGALPPADGKYLFEEVTPLLAGADLVFANLEGPVCDSGKSSKCLPAPQASASPAPEPSPSPVPAPTPMANCFAFRTPSLLAPRLKEAGVNLASLANNHALDYGEDCRIATERTLDQLGIAWSGPPGTFAERTVGTTRIAMAAFHSSPLCNDSNDLKTAARLVRRLKATHDIVIVSFHGGAEGLEALGVSGRREFYFGEDRGDVRAFARGMVDAGADLVLGHGPHVPRAMEIHRGRLIAYSLGNFATFGRFNLFGYKSVSLILEARLDAKGRFAGGRILPTRLLGDGIPAPDPAGRAIELVRFLSRRDLPKSGVRVSQDGTISVQKHP